MSETSETSKADASAKSATTKPDARLKLDPLHVLAHRSAHIEAPPDLGAKAADVITAFVGSWPFVFIHVVWFALWIALRSEPFPFGLLTLLVSLEAIFLSTFVLMSQNRQAEKDHLRDDHEAEEVELLYRINQQQLEILLLLRAKVAPSESGAEVLAIPSLNGTASPQDETPPTS